MPIQNNEHSNKNLSPKQSEKHSKHKEVKSIIMNRLQNYKEEVNDSRTNSIKVVPLTLEDIGMSPVALELVKNKSRETEESVDEQTKRATITSAVQQLIEGVETENKFAVVKVNTPAVDLDKHFNEKERKVFKNNIYNSIKSQLGAELNDDIEEQWGTAFDTIMDIVDAEKRRNK